GPRGSFAKVAGALRRNRPQFPDPEARPPSARKARPEPYSRILQWLGCGRPARRQTGRLVAADASAHSPDLERRARPCRRASTHSPQSLRRLQEAAPEGRAPRDEDVNRRASTAI